MVVTTRSSYSKSKNLFHALSDDSDSDYSESESVDSFHPDGIMESDIDDDCSEDCIDGGSSSKTIDDTLYESFLDSCRKGHLSSVKLYCDSHFIPLTIDCVRIAFEADQCIIVMYFMQHHRSLRLRCITDEPLLFRGILDRYAFNVLRFASIRNDIFQFQPTIFLSFVKECPNIILDIKAVRKTLLEKYLLLYLCILYQNKKKIMNNKIVSNELYLFCPDLYYLVYQSKTPKETPKVSLCPTTFINFFLSSFVSFAFLFYFVNQF